MARAAGGGCVSHLVKLQAGLAELKLSLSEGQQSQLLDYLSMIAKWNKVYNLTAVRDEGEMLTHHILDSLAVVPPLQKHRAGLATQALRVLDVGAGAGLPGVVIAICCPSFEVICVDAVGKKAAFIQQVAVALGLKNLRGLHSRVEKLKPADVQQGFDMITSRAFASLLDFTTLTTPHLAASGVWVAMKAKTAEVESAQLPKNVAVFHVEQIVVPSLDEERCLVWLRQT
jgi:16S rRNA (guanine527-N7)-methyltransferase